MAESAHTEPAKKPFGVLTMAFGSKPYIHVAKYLARSLTMHSPSIAKVVVTDSDDPDLAKLFDEVLPLRPEYGSNLRQKLYLDAYSPFDRTLFVDCDSIVLRDISYLEDLFSGLSFTAIGNTYFEVGDGNSAISVETALSKMDKPARLPRFNGGVYYFDRSQRAQDVFSTAREILPHYRDYGLNEFRGDGPNEEALISIGMAINGVDHYDDSDDVIMRTPIGLKGGFHLDAIEGACSFIKHDTRVEPAIIHFTMGFAKRPFYLRETLRIKAHESEGIGRIIGTGKAYLLFVLYTTYFYPVRWTMALWLWSKKLVLDQVKRMLPGPYNRLRQILGRG